MKRILSTILVVLFTIAIFAACTPVETGQTEPGESTTKSTTSNGGGTTTSEGETTDFPRDETFYFFSGMGVLPTTFNPLDGNPNWPTGSTMQYLLYEALFMMNMLTGELEPLIADSYSVQDDGSIKVVINEKAHFNDGSDLTAEDVKYSYDLGNKYPIAWSQYWNHIDSVEVVDETTIVIHQNEDNPNTLSNLDSLQMVPIVPKAIWEKVEEDSNEDIAEIRKFNNLTDPVGSGMYKVYTYNDQGIYLIRDENYWGVERFGKLPGPKYLAQPIYKSNDALAVAFKNNEVDLAQAFIPKIWEMQEDNPNIGTYIDEPPYHLEGGMVCLVFNTSVPGLDDPEVRRALAYAINYKLVGETAMSGYTKEVVPLMALTNGSEDKYINKEELEDLFWSYDPDEANRILDEMGAEKGSDGIRVLPDGTKMSWTIQSGYGWTDWNATCEVVAQSAKAIGVEIIPEMPESAQFIHNRQVGEFEITMTIPGENPRPSQPWYRYQYIMSDEDVPDFGELSFTNFGRFHNDRANEIVAEIPSVTDEAKLRELHTEINKIFLEEIPEIPVMYRPFQFYEYNETYWTGFPTADDGTGIPPMHDRGAGIKMFFNLEPVK